MQLIINVYFQNWTGPVDSVENLIKCLVYYHNHRPLIKLIQKLMKL